MHNGVCDNSAIHSLAYASMLHMPDMIYKAGGRIITEFDMTPFCPVWGQLPGHITPHPATTPFSLSVYVTIYHVIPSAIPNC